MTRDRSVEVEVVILAHGHWLALLATIGERERIVASNDLPVVLCDLAVLTAVDRPAKGHVLSFWAAYLQDASVALSERPSLH